MPDVLPHELAPGLWRWSLPHPHWKPDARPGSVDDWPQHVASTACELDSATLFIDPLAPAVASGSSEHDVEQFWQAVDAIVERAAAPAYVLTTITWHRRSRAQFARRYGATVLRANAPHPEGVERISIPRAGESEVWIPRRGALVVGDRLLGDGSGGLRLCHASWLAYLRGRPTLEDVRAALAGRLLDLPLQMVLTSHGDPVLVDAREALERALNRTES